MVGRSEKTDWVAVEPERWNGMKGRVSGEKKHGRTRRDAITGAVRERRDRGAREDVCGVIARWSVVEMVGTTRRKSRVCVRVLARVSSRPKTCISKKRKTYSQRVYILRKKG